MADRRESILRRLADEGDKIIGFFEGLDQTAWDRMVYTEGGAWTVRTVLAHQLSAEQALLALIENIAAGGPGAPPELMVDPFNEAEAARMSEMTPVDILPIWRRERAALIRRVELLSDADLDRIGRHPFLGETSLEEILKLIYRHNMAHARDVKRALDNS